jgi:hypothetical protein
MKTNGARFLESLGIPFELREYEVDPNDLSALTVAKKIGMPPEQVFKTLLTTAGRTSTFLPSFPATPSWTSRSWPAPPVAQGRDGSAQRCAAADRLHSRRRHVFGAKKALSRLRR